MDVKDKIAIVTGGASGLGLGTVRGLVNKGAKVFIFDLNEEAARDICVELGANVDFALVDVTSEESVGAGIQKVIATFGAIHICINCAGVGTPQKVLGRSGTMPLANFKKVLDINLNGTFNVLRLAAAEMIKNEPLTEDGERGIIINTASIAAFDGQMGQAAYAASKAGVAGMTLPIARDLSSYGIRTNTIAPGLFRTPMAAGLPEPVIENLERMVEFPKRLGQSSEYASLVIFMLENEYLNGEVIRLDGGIRMAPR